MTCIADNPTQLTHLYNSYNMIQSRCLPQVVKHLSRAIRETSHLWKLFFFFFSPHLWKLLTSQQVIHNRISTRASAAARPWKNYFCYLLLVYLWPVVFIVRYTHVKKKPNCYLYWKLTSLPLCIFLIDWLIMLYFSDHGIIRTLDLPIYITRVKVCSFSNNLIGTFDLLFECIKHVSW